MASLAYQDNDPADAQRHTKLAEIYEKELQNRKDAR